MKNRWQRSQSRRPAERTTGPLASALEQPRVRLRPASDGAAPRKPRPHRRWAQPLPIAGALLVLLALLGYLSVYNQTTKRTQVLVAAHALPAGSVLHASDLQSAGLASDRNVLATLVPARQRTLVLGRSLKTAVAAGAPLPQASLAAPGKRTALFTLAVPVLHALGGDLSPGDRVSVLATFTSTAGQTVTRAVARNLQVVSVGRASGFDSSAQTIPITVALPDPSIASALALANQAGKLDLLREGGSGQTAPIPPASANGSNR